MFSSEQPEWTKTDLKQAKEARLSALEGISHYPLKLPGARGWASQS